MRYGNQHWREQNALERAHADEVRELRARIEASPDLLDWGLDESTAQLLAEATAVAHELEQSEQQQPVYLEMGELVDRIADAVADRLDGGFQ